MKKLYTKINEQYARWKQWGEGGIVGSAVVSSVNMAIVMFLFLLLFYAVGIFNPFEDKEVSLNESEETWSDECNVAGINLHGSLLTYIPDYAEGNSFVDYDVTASENVLWTINDANDNPDVSAIVIEVDSPGGSPVSGEEIADAVKNSEKPVIAFIRDRGLSSAYLAITSADKIFASANSDVGSIGVTSSYLSNAEKNKKEGLVYEELTSGKFKDSGSSDRPLNAEERALFMRDINIMHNNFVEAVAKNRNISVEKVRSIADGSSVLGEKAKELGLIDEIGGIFEVKKYLEEIIGEKPEICW
jgi:signal peptide peptidase SppA